MNVAAKDIMGYEIINKDCIKYLRNEDNWNKFDLIFCDPPYNIGIDYGGGKRKDLMPEEKYLVWCADWIELCYECLKNNGSFWLLTPEEWLADLIKNCEDWFKVRTIITWVENFGQYRQNNFGKCARFLIYCVKDEKNFTFNADAIRVPSDRQLKYRDKRANPKGKIPSNVWNFSRVCGSFKSRVKGVPTQLPTELLTRVVLCSSNKCDLVLDPMCGSASTGVACLQNGRDFIGIDKSAEYCKVSRKRLKEINNGRNG